VELRSLVVEEEQRGNGLGRALIEHILLKARKRKVKQVLTITGSPDMFRQFGFDFFRADEKYALINDLLSGEDDRSS
jgi:N-acetylglutamate synthase-like GNAT family acetyltransferase